MYTYNKNDKSYTFSSDELDIDNLINMVENPTSDNNIEETQKQKQIEVINGGNELNISPVSDYLEVEKPKNEKKQNIIIPTDNK